MAEIADLNMEFTPFEDDGAVLSIGDLSVENGARGLLVHGDIEFGRDEASLSRIRSLISALKTQEEAMSLGGRTQAPAAEIDTIKNPFI